METAMSFMIEPQKSPTAILQYLAVYKGQPCSLWETLMQGHEYQEARITEGQLGGRNMLMNKADIVPTQRLCCLERNMDSKSIITEIIVYLQLWCFAMMKEY